MMFNARQVLLLTAEFAILGCFACSPRNRPVSTTQRALTPGWTPHALDPSTQAWFTAAAGVSTDPNDATSVTAWTDQLHGNVLQQDFAPGRPQYKPNGWGSGVPTITFGGNQLLKTASAWSGVPTGTEPAYTILAVLRPAAAQSAAVAAWWDPSGQGYASVGLKQVGTLNVLDSWRVYANAPGEAFAGSQDLGTTAHVVAWRYDSSTGVITEVVDGVPASSSPMPAIGPLAAMPLIVGARSVLPTGLFRGDLSELRIVARALGDDEIQNYMEYARSQWQITTPAPSANPCLDASNNPAPDTTRCDDGNAQTYGDHCSQGACVGSTPPAGSPAELSPLAWYHANPQEVVVTENGVSTWFDRTQNHRDLMQPFYYGRPTLGSTWTGGRPSLHFSGGQGLRRDSWSGSPLGTSQPFTVLAVFQSGSAGQSSSIASWWNSSYSVVSASLSASNGDSVPSVLREGESGVSQSLTDPVALGTTPHAVVWRYTPDTLTITVDGHSLPPTAFPPVDAILAPVFLVGMRTYLPTGLFTGDLADLAIVPRSISDAEVAAYTQYAVLEWGTSHGTQVITSYTPPPSTNIVGDAPAANVMSLSMALPLQDLPGLQTFVSHVSDPTDPLYRHYIDASTVLATQAPSASDYAALVSWAQGQGFSVVTHGNRVGIDISGTVAQVERAFYAKVVLATRPDGSQYYRLDRQPSIDLTVPVLGVSGLDNYVLPRIAGGGSAPSGGFQSSDLRGAYLGAGSTCSTLTGTGQKIGIFSLLTGFDQADVSAYEVATGVTGALTPQVRTENDPNGLPPASAPPLAVTGNGETYELNLDIDMALSMAPGAQVVVFEGQNADSVFQDMVDNPDIKQLSSSWVLQPSALTQTLFTLMAAQGQSLFQASGDFGGYQPASGKGADGGTLMCPPAAQTDAEPTAASDWRALTGMTVVGGTVLTTSSTAYSGEAAWSSSGGGVLTTVPMPAYQSAVNPANAQVSTTNRNLPDVAMAATQLFIVTTDCSMTTNFAVTGSPIPNSMPAATLKPCPAASLTSGQQLQVGGTSAAAPLWAGFMALANQRSAATGLGSVGFANPALYQIGKNATKAATAFNDISGTTTSTNQCGVGYNSAAGYDLITGLGTPKCGLITQLSGGGVPSAIARVNGGPAGPFICVSGTNFTSGGTVTLTYTGIPQDRNADGTPGTRVVTTTAPVGSGTSVSLTDNQISAVEKAVDEGTTKCTADDIASGIVSVQMLDNTTGISSTSSIPARFFCEVNQPNFEGGCDVATVDIVVGQYGSCNFVPAGGGVSTGPNAAYVIYQLFEIANMGGGGLPFSFEQQRVYTRQNGVRRPINPGLSIYPRIFGPFAWQTAPFNVPVFSDFNFAVDPGPGDMALVVTTTAGDGTFEAAGISYPLEYDYKPTDPPVEIFNFKASSPSTVMETPQVPPYPAADDCSTLGLGGP